MDNSGLSETEIEPVLVIALDSLTAHLTAHKPDCAYFIHKGKHYN